MAYKNIAAGWINTDKNGGKYLAVTLSEDVKKGEKLYLRKNEFKKEGDKSPDYRYSVKIEDEPPTEEASQESIDVADQIPF